jgi:23S rRNA pseudouridine1911/1915/1917 synthase
MKKERTFEPSKPKQFSLKVMEPMPLMVFLTNKLSGYSRSSIKSLLSHRRVLVNKAPTTQFDFELKTGDEISIKSSSAQRELKNPKMKIVFEDDHIIVIEKKEGFLSVGTDQEKEKTAYFVLNEYMKEENPRNRIFIVHRLDKETSGVMMFAKSRLVQNILQDNWNDIILERSYTAVVSGEVQNEQDIIESFLTEDKQKRMHSSRYDNEGQRSVTAYQLIKTNQRYSMLKLNLETGRKNQIRVHLQSIGHPIVGDKKYGGIYSPIGRMCLHAKTLCFIHPITREEMKFEMPVPKHFFGLLNEINK